MKVYLLALAALCLGAQAQVTKCTDPKTGAVSYTDGKCDAGQGAKSVQTTDNAVAATPTAILYREERQAEPAGAVSMGSAAPAPQQPGQSQSRSKRRAPTPAVDLVPTCGDYNGVLTCASDTDSYTGRTGGTSFMRASDGRMCTSVMSPRGAAMDCR